MNNINLLECIGKFVMFQNDEFRKVYSVVSRSKAIGLANNLINQREYWNNIAASALANMIPNLSLEEKYSLLGQCSYHIHRCNAALEQLLGDTIKDEIIAKLAQRYTHNVE